MPCSPTDSPTSFGLQTKESSVLALLRGSLVEGIAAWLKMEPLETTGRDAERQLLPELTAWGP